jgi:hypothetical protein
MSANPPIETTITVINGVDGYTPDMLRKRTPEEEAERKERLARYAEERKNGAAMDPRAKP